MLKMRKKVLSIVMLLVLLVNNTWVQIAYSIVLDELINNTENTDIQKNCDTETLIDNWDFTGGGGTLLKI